MSKNKIKQIPTQEIKSVILNLKFKKHSHIEERQYSQVNEGFIIYIDNTINELTQVLKERNAA